MHVADLLSREGHPLADRVVAAARDNHDADSPGSSRRALGMAAGAMLVIGTVVAGALGLNNGPDGSPSAAAGEPVGALPGNGAPAHNPAAAPASQDFTTPAEDKAPPQTAPEPAGEIGRPASIAPPVQANAPRPAVPETPTPVPPQRSAPAPQQAPEPGPVTSLAEPVTETVGSSTLTDVVAPVTNTLDDTLQPALSLIGGLLGR